MRYFGDNVVFFRIDSIRSPDPGGGSGFYFAHPNQLVALHSEFDRLHPDDAREPPSRPG
jgi:hypothetical protein